MKRQRGPNILSLALALLLAAGATSAQERRGGIAAGEPSGPVPVRILSPLGVRFFQFSPDRAGSLGEGIWNARLELSESNVLHPPREGPVEFATDLDFELTRLNLSVDYGLTRSWDVGAELPVFYAHDGFLDPFIKGVEKAVGKLKPRRQAEDQHSFSYRLARNGEVFFEGREGSGLGDAAITAKRSLLEQRGSRPAVALRGALKLPTGDRDHGFGNGLVDLAFGIAAEWDLYPWLLTAGGQLTVPLGEVSGMPGLDTQPVASGYFDAGYQAGAKVSLHLQLAARTASFGVARSTPSPLDAQSRESLTGDVVQVTPAVGWRLDSGYTVFFGISEDFMSSEDAAADITFFTTISRGFGGRDRL